MAAAERSVPALERRALLFFAACTVVSLVLGGIDLAGVHSVALRVAAMFSLVMGVAVLLIKASQQQRANREE